MNNPGHSFPRNRARNVRAVATALLAAVGLAVAPRAHAGRLLMGSGQPWSVSNYDAQTGQSLGTFAGPLSGDLIPAGMTFGPDGNLYLSSSHNSSATGEIRRYDGQTGAFIDSFVPAGSSPLVRPFGLTFGPDGNLYVSAFIMSGPATPAGLASGVLRYDGQSGAFMGAFVPAGSGGLTGAAGLTFGPDGNLYVASLTGHSVLRYDGHTGAFIDAFVPAGSHGLDSPSSLAFGPDGNLYVANTHGSDVLRYDGRTGAFMNEFVPAGSGGMVSPFGLAFGPDGNLYVSGAESGNVARYDGKTGASLGDFVPAGAVQTAVAVPIVFTPPAAPDQLRVTAASTSEVGLSWTNNADDAHALAIWRMGGGSAWRRIGVAPPSATTFTDTNASPNKHYTYRIRAISFAGASGWSNEAAATTGDAPAAPAAPTDLTAVVESGPQATLTWTDNSRDETAYAVWRKAAGGDWSRVGVLAPNTTHFTDVSISPNVDYTYEVRAINSVGASGWSNQVTLNSARAPAAPSNLTVRVMSGTQVNLTWTNNSANATAYAIWRLVAGGVWQRIGVMPPGATTFIDTTMSAGVTVTYRVRAINAAGASEWSNESSGMTTP